MVSTSFFLFSVHQYPGQAAGAHQLSSGSASSTGKATRDDNFVCPTLEHLLVLGETILACPSSHLPLLIFHSCCRLGWSRTDGGGSGGLRIDSDQNQQPVSVGRHSSEAGGIWVCGAGRVSLTPGMESEFKPHTDPELDWKSHSPQHGHLGPCLCSFSHTTNKG